MIRRHNKNNDNTNNSSLEVMNYLIKKLEARQKKVLKFKNMFKELDSFESFYSQRKEIYLLLNDLEEDLKQATFSIKALTMQNQALVKDINIKINENKNLTNQLNFTLGENENLKLKLNNFNENNNDALSYPINDLNNVNNYNNNLVNVNIESIKVDDEEEYDEPKTKNLDINNKSVNNRVFEKININKMNKQSQYEQLSNVKNIIQDMRKNKKDLKKIIEQYFKGKKMGS